MRNPWLDIPLADYEGHMALPEIGQADLLADIFDDMLKRHCPRSVAVLGCAGGNGFDRISATITTRVVAIDLNSTYVDQLRARFCDLIPNLELIIGDVQTTDFQFAPVEFAFAGLLLEYVDVETVLKRLYSMLASCGVLGTVIQIESQSVPAVTPSPFRSLQSLSSLMRTVTPSHLKKLAEKHGFWEMRSRVEQARGGKTFAVQEFCHAPPNKAVNPSGGSGGS